MGNRWEYDREMENIIPAPELDRGRAIVAWYAYIDTVTIRTSQVFRSSHGRMPRSTE